MYPRNPSVDSVETRKVIFMMFIIICQTFSDIRFTATPSSSKPNHNVSSNNTTRKSMFAISVYDFPLFSSWVTTQETTPLPYKNVAGHGVYTLPLKFSTLPVKYG